MLILAPHAVHIEGFPRLVRIRSIRIRGWQVRDIAHRSRTQYRRFDARAMSRTDQGCAAIDKPLCVVPLSLQFLAIACDRLHDDCAHCYVLSRAWALISRSFKTMSDSYQASNRQYVKPALPSRIPPRSRYI